jgi:hypothetical protein
VGGPTPGRWCTAGRSGRSIAAPDPGQLRRPRTVAEAGGLGSDSPLTPGSFTFQNGVVITANTGTAVYPVVSGTARIGCGDELIVETEDERTFQYFHMYPAVVAGQRVVAYHTILGTVLPRCLHVHLSEIDSFRIHNPVDPGHLEPYVDHTVLVVETVEFAKPGGAGARARPACRPDPDRRRRDRYAGRAGAPASGSAFRLRRRGSSGSWRRPPVG